VSAASEAVGPGSGRAVRTLHEVRTLVRTTGRLVRTVDLSAAAATLTYFAGIAVVPWLLLATWTTTWGRSDDAAQARLLDLRVLVPPDMGARPAFDTLVQAGTHVSLVGAVVLLFPASFYGEGVRRACLAVLPEGDRFTGWRARILLVVGLVVVLPLLTRALLGTGGLLAPLAPEGGGGGVADLLLRILVGFTVLWLVLSVILTWVFRAVAPGGPRWWVAGVGALVTGSFLAGFLHGFQLFLSLPVDVGGPFAGLGFVGGAVAVGLWLYLLHVVLLVGWVFTRALEEQVAAW